MNIVFVVMLLIGIIVETVRNGGDAALASLLEGGNEAVTLCITLLGAYMFWMGLMGVMQKSGLMEALSKRLRRAIGFLFPNAGEAAGAISMNLAANMLGMGNAATPFGLTAMRLLDEKNPKKGIATNEMCTLLAVNASCLELLPTTLIALRQAYGSASPAAVVLPTLLSSALATVVAVILCKVLSK
ncbi:MAG: nucleoside recognition domain-containing protein [Clostridia bacterium]|nr:nucleoside recognition domain-containing protein [Clostridia bacterium]